jgi:hypothetical protein
MILNGTQMIEKDGAMRGIYQYFDGDEQSAECDFKMKLC